MTHHRSTHPGGLLVVELSGHRYAIRADRKTRGLLHLKHTWPSGRRYWRPITPDQWERLPLEVRRQAAARFLSGHNLRGPE